MKIDTIFFDFDGVLAESVQIKTEAFQGMYVKHGTEFSLRVREHHLNHGGVSRYEKFKVYNGEWLGEKVDENRIQELAQEFSSLVVQGVIDAEEVKGARNFLESDKTKNYTSYIITGTPTVEIKQILEGRNMTHFFKAAYGSPEKKDYWVEKILKEENLQAESCIFIGDTLADYRAAEANKVTFVLRETEEGRELFKEYKGYRIKDMTDLQKVIDTIDASE